ncbi:MAG: CRISPR-associated endonuclease Cas2 [Patescibacteria group bacterium]
MRLSVTDKFLWDVYNLFSKAGNILDSAFKYPTMYNSLPGPKNPIFKRYKKEIGAREFSKLIYYLKKKGYIKVENLKNKKAILLTKDGIGKALKASFKIEKGKKRRDGRWIMIIFDIPQKHKKSRELLRSILLNLGYKMFQQSVWVSPYDISEKTERLVQMYLLDKYVKIFLIEKI